MPPDFLPDAIDVASDRKKVSTLLEYVALASKTAEEQQVYFTGPLGLLENQGVQQAESNLEVKDISLSFKRKPSGKSPAVFMLPIIDICQKLRIIVFDICRKGGIMPRPIRCRRIERLPVYRSFSPDDITAAESVQMTVDEFEALRLLDDEGLTQERINELRKQYVDLAKQAQEDVKTIDSITGYNSAYSQDASSGAWQSMSQETGDELNGRFTALQESNERISESVLAGLTVINSMLAISTSTNGAVLEIRNLMITSNSYMEDMVKYTRKSYNEWTSKLDSIVNNTKNL